MTMGLTGMKRLRRMADLFTAKDGDPQTGLYSSSVSRSLDPFTNPPVIITLFRFTQQPSNQSVTSGNTATFSVTVAGGTPPYSYQWQLDSGSGFANIGGATSASYETPTLTTGDTGNEYRCVVTDDVASEITSNAALLTVVANLTIDTQPQPQTADVGETATFSIVVSGGLGTLTYQWQVDSGAGFANISGATSASYETPPLAEIDDGNEYRCRVRDSLNNEVFSDSALLTVTTSSFMLMESGDYLLLETGDRILLEIQ